MTDTPKTEEQKHAFALQERLEDYLLKLHQKSLLVGALHTLSAENQYRDHARAELKIQQGAIHQTAAHMSIPLDAARPFVEAELSRLTEWLSAEEAKLRAIAERAPYCGITKDKKP